MKKGGKMKTIGGLKDILECPNLKSGEQIMVEVVINQNTIRLNLNEFTQLLLREEKRPIIKNNISDIINNEEYKRKYGIEKAVLEAPKRIEWVCLDIIKNYREKIQMQEREG